LTGEYDPVNYPFLSNQTNFKNWRRTRHIYSMFENNDLQPNCWSNNRTLISCPTHPLPRNYSCEYELYNDLIQKNAEACWSFSGNCAANKHSQEGGIRNGKSQFEALEYMATYWYCESSSNNGALPKVYHRFYTVSTGSSGMECQGIQASFGVDLNNDEIFVAPAAMSAAGIPLSCGSMDETTGCSECSYVRARISHITKNVTRASRSNTGYFPLSSWIRL
jgi:hypothetical protein